MGTHKKGPGRRATAAGALAVAPALILALSTAPPALADVGGDPHKSAAGGAHVATTAGATSASSMETVHAGYLGLTLNIADLRSRITAWQGGDEGSLGVALEKLERIDATLGHVQWPASLSKAIAKTHAAIVPMELALRRQDQRAAVTAATAFGDASHDVTHDFYGIYLPPLKPATFSAMAPHTTYLDLSANINDLKSRVTNWQNGDEGSLGVAQEKIERIEALVKHVAPGGPLAGPVAAIQRSLKEVSSALAAKNVRAAQTALTPLSDASHDLTHDFYAWAGTTPGINDPACVQASYLDLTANVSDLRARVTAWQQGDEGSLGIAQEKLERIEALVGHAVWPKEMARPIYATGALIAPMEKALKAKDIAGAQALATRFGDASHDVTHDYYGVWIPVAHMAGNAAHGEAAHGEASTAPSADVKTMVLGAFGLVNAIVIAGAAVLKRKYGRERPVALPRGAVPAIATIARGSVPPRGSSAR
ncbi:MAG TPA: hypothetical protein VFN74_08040 [Chloroflexota bacterium]|nr:hypothetical protein [Chloroflexota bacterium]